MCFIPCSRWSILWHHLCCRLVKSASSSLALFDCYELLIVPSELRCNIVVICDILGINLVVLQDGVKDFNVENLGVATYEHVIVGTIVDVSAIFPLGLDSFRIVKLNIFNCLWLSISCFNDYALAVWLQIHVLNVRMSPTNINEILLHQCIIQV